MTCPVCHNIQCYVCSKNVTNYNHFSDAGIYGGSSSSRKQCPLNDNVNQRHENEVNAAEKEALKKVREENPDLTEEELKIKVSERVKAADDRRRNMGPMGGVLFDAFGAGGPAGLYGMPLPAVPPLVPPRRIGRAAAVQAHPLHRNRRQALPNEAFDDDIRAMEAAMAQEFGFPQNPARQEYEIQLALLEADNQRRRQQREQEAHPMDGFQADYHGQYRERLQEQQALQQRLMQGRAQRPAAVPIMPNYQPIAMQVQPHVHYFADAPPPLPAYPYPIAAAAGGGVQPPQYPGVGDFHLQAQLQAPRTQEQAQNLARARHRAAQAQADRLQEQQDAPRRGLNGRGRRLGVGVAGGWDQWYPRMEDN